MIGFVKSDEPDVDLKTLSHMAASQWVGNLLLRARVCQLEDQLSGEHTGRVEVLVKKAIEGIPWILDAIDEGQAVELRSEHIKARIESVYEDFLGIAEAYGVNPVIEKRQED